MAVVGQPRISLWVSLGLSLSGRLSLLYGHHIALLGLSGGGGHSRDQTVGKGGKDSLSAGDGGSLVVLAAHGGHVVDDGGVVVGQGEVVVHQGSVVQASGVDKPGLGLGLSSCSGDDS